MEGDVFMENPLDKYRDKDTPEPCGCRIVYTSVKNKAKVADRARRDNAAGLEELQTRLNTLEAAGRDLLNAADHLLDAGNPQDWRPMDVAANRLRTLLTPPTGDEKGSIT